MDCQVQLHSWKAASKCSRPIDTGQIPTSSLQELPFHSPISTPVAARKFADKPPLRRKWWFLPTQSAKDSAGFPDYDQLPEAPRKVERVRQLERGYSMDTHDRSPYLDEMRRAKEEQRRDDFRRPPAVEVERRPSRIQRQPPVHLTRIKPPSHIVQRKPVSVVSRLWCNVREKHAASILQACVHRWGWSSLGPLY